MVWYCEELWKLRFWRSYEFLSVTGKSVSKNDPRRNHFQVCTSFGRGVKRPISIFSWTFWPKRIWRSCDGMMVWWCNDMITWQYNNVVIRWYLWYDDMMMWWYGLMVWWYDGTMIRRYDDMIWYAEGATEHYILEQGGYGTLSPGGYASLRGLRLFSPWK